MAHKRNPWNFENVVGMSKQVLAQIINANLNLSSDHQRDLTDSAPSRFYGLPVAGVAHMAKRLNGVMAKIEVNEENMKRNLEMSKGAIAAEPLYLLLSKHGHPMAHEKAKELAHKALDEKTPLLSVAQQDTSLAPYLAKFSDQEKSVLASPEQHYTGLAAPKAKKIAADWRSKT